LQGLERREQEGPSIEACFYNTKYEIKKFPTHILWNAPFCVPLALLELEEAPGVSSKGEGVDIETLNSGGDGGEVLASGFAFFFGWFAVDDMLGKSSGGVFDG
jgi:hypothetical protein